MSQLKLMEGQRGMNVEMFTALEPDVSFAEFVIPDSSKSEVTIFAKTWGNRAWGNFSCTSNSYTRTR